ncbi:predicted protein [Nematostella vectensis]|uniref:Fe2OG dioxygenase domain-containing protein n=1 Tax=Nematostella vectensis TaxID=45351 RepID=A7SIA5_NEMVE|nr:predicted protein [Nematostella vectensis]|eukprot:XP_001628623.1 predicted protein [Nematostella vectensis]
MAEESKPLDLTKYIVREAPPTVYYIPEFVTESEQADLLKQVYSAPKPKWTQLSGRRLQNWGGLPHPKGMVQDKLPPWLLKHATYLGKLPVFKGKAPNHVLVNEYEPGQGIMPHEDGPLFFPVVSTISLGSHTLLDFYHPLKKNTESQVTTLQDRYFMSLLLEPRSLLLLTEDLYTSYLHGIEGRAHDIFTTDIVNREQCKLSKELGSTLIRSTRISLTIRHVPKILNVKVKLRR